MRAIVGALVIVLALLLPATAQPVRPFKSDGCSGGMSTFWRMLHREPPWIDCCTVHDRSYWRGGTQDQRVAADRALYVCVRDRGYPMTAAIMWIAVRLGGTPFFPFDWRWGYGRDYGTSWFYDR